MSYPTYPRTVGGNSGCIYRGSMRTPVKRAGRSVAVWLAVSLAVLGAVLLVASVLVAYLVADHSSSDSSVSSVIAIGLGSLGFLAFVLSGVLLGVVALARLWRRFRQPVRGTPGGR
jgi:TRAP-type C4-dicarboxylate transport system permease small subunit